MNIKNKPEKDVDLDPKSLIQIPAHAAKEQLFNKHITRIIVYVCFAIGLHAMYAFGPAKWVYQEVKGSTFESINIVIFYGIYVFPVVAGSMISAWGLANFLLKRNKGDLKRSLIVMILPALVAAYVTLSGLALESKYEENARELAKYNSQIEIARNNERARIRTAFDRSGSYYVVDNEYDIDRNSFDTDIGKGYKNKLLTTLTDHDIALIQGNSGTSPLPAYYEKAFDDPTKIRTFNPGISNFTFDVVETTHTWSLVDSEKVSLYRLSNKNHNLLILVGDGTLEGTLIDVLKTLIEKPATEIELIHTQICAPGYLANYCINQNIPSNPT